MVKIMENPIKIDDLGVPLFLETPIWWFWCQNDCILGTFHNLEDQPSLGPLPNGLNGIQMGGDRMIRSPLTWTRPGLILQETHKHPEN